MDAVFWSSLFEHAKCEPGASEEQIQDLLKSIVSPLTADELIRALRFFQSNPFPPGDPLHDQYVPADPHKWVKPFRRLPASYLDFLRWSNGGTFCNGAREFEIWPAVAPRRMMSACYFYEFAPLVIPFGGNEEGDFFGFDTNCPPVNGEFPIVYLSHGSLGEYFPMDAGFIDFCRGSTNPSELYWEKWRKKHRDKAIAALRARSEQRFGPLPPEALQKLEQKSLPELNAMIRAFEEAKSLQELGL